MLCDRLLNMQETKYGVEPTKLTLRETNIQFDFERICIVYETIDGMVHFLFIYAIMYILLYKCRYTYYSLFICL